MSSIPSTLWLALLSAFLGALCNIFARSLLKENLKGKDVLALNFLMIACVLLVFTPWCFHVDVERQWRLHIPLSFVLILTVAIVDLVGNYFYFKAFEDCEAAVVTPVLSLTPAIVFFLGWMLLGEKASALRLLLALMITGLVVWLSLGTKRLKDVYHSHLRASLLAAGCFAVSAIPSRYLLMTELTNAPTLYFLRACVISLGAGAMFGTGLKIVTRKQGGLLFVRSLLVLAQWLLLYVALAKGEAGVVYTVANVSPVFVVLLSPWLLREPASSKKFIAAVLILGLAIVLKLVK